MIADLMSSTPRRVVFSDVVLNDETHYQTNIEGWELEDPETPIVGITTEIMHIGTGRIISEHTVFGHNWNDLS